MESFLPYLTQKCMIRLSPIVKDSSLLPLMRMGLVSVPLWPFPRSGRLWILGLGCCNHFRVKILLHTNVRRVLLWGCGTPPPNNTQKCSQLPNPDRVFSKNLYYNYMVLNLFVLENFGLYAPVRLLCICSLVRSTLWCVAPKEKKNKHRKTCMC